MKHWLVAVVCSLGAVGWLPVQASTIQIAHVYSKTGPLQAYGEQTQRGLVLGLEYATGGTMKVAGKSIVVIEKDDRGQPELGRQLLTEAYTIDKADIAVGPTASPVALAMVDVAAAHKKILLVEPAVADSITGSNWNRYVFRTGRNSTQDAISNAVALDKPGTQIAILAQDSSFGREGARAFRETLKSAALVHEEFLPANTTDFTAGGRNLVDAFKNRSGRKVVFVLWAGGNPFQIADDGEFKRHGIDIATGGNTMSGMVNYNRFPGMEGATYYYFNFAKNPANRWLNLQHLIRYNAPPDFFTAGGFAAAMALVTALKSTAGSTDTDTLIRTMEGMSFETPKGTMTFRSQDHQALQSMYHFRVSQGARTGTMADLYLVKEIPPDQISPPIRNQRPGAVALHTPR